MVSNITVGNDTIPVRPDEAHEYVVETALVAKGYGVSAGVIRRHKQNHPDELLEGTHWVVQKLNTLGGKQDQTFWTKLGVVTLGFFIKSQRAKEFRKAAARLIVYGRQQEKPMSYPQALRKLADAVERGDKTMEALSIIAPRHEFGSISERTGQPRTRLVPAYFRSGLNADGSTRHYLELQTEFAGWVEVAS
jgi:hypothetical protein